jgi:hypothetical protein
LKLKLKLKNYNKKLLNLKLLSIMQPQSFITCTTPYPGAVAQQLFKANLLNRQNDSRVFRAIEDDDDDDGGDGGDGGGGGGGGSPWVKLQVMSERTRKVALLFACHNEQRPRRLPTELVEMVSDFLVEILYVSMPTDATMNHLARIPTGLPPFINVRTPLIYTRSRRPEECTQTTTEEDGASKLTLNFLTTDGHIGALHYK